MEEIKEYYPSLSVKDYELGKCYMFIRNLNHQEKKIPKNVKKVGNMKESGGLELEGGKGGFDLEDRRPTGARGGSEIDKQSLPLKDKGTGQSEKGGLDLDFEKNPSSVTPEYREMDAKKKRFAIYSYEIGKVIGINEDDEKIYVQFEDTSKDSCHVFKTGISSQQFDIIDSLIREKGR